jgi:hypothetical protein
MAMIRDPHRSELQVLKQGYGFGSEFTNPPLRTCTPDDEAPGWQVRKVGCGSLLVTNNTCKLCLLVLLYFVPLQIPLFMVFSTLLSLSQHRLQPPLKSFLCPGPLAVSLGMGLSHISF